MKIGIDIKDSDISRALIIKLKNEGYYIVNMALDKNEIIGEEVFKETLLANTAKLDFFLLIKNNQEDDEVKIYFKNQNLSKLFSEELIESLKQNGINNTNIYKGEEFYIIQNVESPTVIIKVNINKNKIKEKELIESIVYCIKFIRDKFYKK